MPVAHSHTCNHPQHHCTIRMREPLWARDQRPCAAAPAVACLATGAHSDSRFSSSPRHRQPRQHTGSWSPSIMPRAVQQHGPDRSPRPRAGAKLANLETRALCTAYPGARPVGWCPSPPGLVRACLLGKALKKNPSVRLVTPRFPSFVFTFIRNNFTERPDPPMARCLCPSWKGRVARLT